MTASSDGILISRRSDGQPRHLVEDISVRNNEGGRKRGEGGWREQEIAMSEIDQQQTIPDASMPCIAVSLQCRGRPSVVHLQLTTSTTQNQQTNSLL